MTSLKNKYANEIAEAMAKLLGDKEFTEVFHKEASIEKEAATEAFTNFYKEFTTNPPVDGIAADSLYRKYEGGMSGAEKEEAKKMISAKYQAPGESVPPPADDGQAAADVCEKCGQNPCVCEAADDRYAVAADFTLAHLTKLANVLDKKEFTNIADILDEAMQKIAAKKKDKKKEEKEDKKKKKEDKEEKEKKEEKEDKKEEEEDKKKD